MRPRELRLLVMHVSTRCDQTCAHCSIWRGRGRSGAELGVGERVDLIRQARLLGARSVLFTGGEPLLCDHLEVLAREAHGLGLAVQIASNGLGLARATPWIAEVVAEVCLSVEGPEAIHDRVRGPAMFSRLRDAIAALRSRSQAPRLIGRCVVTSLNASVLDETVAAAKALGLDAVSFLPVDVKTQAFGGEPQGRRGLRPAEADVEALRAAVSRLAAAGDLGEFVIEDGAKLMRMADGFLEGDTLRRAPECNAPEWSSVVEADGALRPCFFQPVLARTGGAGSLRGVRGSDAYATALRGLGSGNPICAACVCPKRAPTGVEAVRARVGAILRRALPTSALPGVPA